MMKSKLILIAALLFTNCANAGPIEYTNKPATEHPYQIQAQRRIEARTNWSKVRPEIKECIDDFLELDGLSIAVLIGNGILPSDNMIKNYREECFATVLGKRRSLGLN